VDVPALFNPANFMKYSLLFVGASLLGASSIACVQAQGTQVQPASTAPHPPIPIKFSLKEAGFVTLVIEDADGKRVRNLVSETPFPSGDNTAWWDGLDDVGRDPEAASHAVYHIPGKLVRAGTYSVRGLFRNKQKAC